MDISKGLVSAISELGFPIVMSIILLVVIWKASQYLFKFFNQLVGDQQKNRMASIEAIKLESVKAIEKLEANLEEEWHVTQKEIQNIKTMLVRLIDRVRQLSEEIYDHDTTARAVWDIGRKKPKHRTRAERREQLEDELADIGKNGDNYE